jgi:hypothetical protein
MWRGGIREPDYGITLVLASVNLLPLATKTLKVDLLVTQAGTSLDLGELIMALARPHCSSPPAARACLDRSSHLVSLFRFRFRSHQTQIARRVSGCERPPGAVNVPELSRAERLG